MTERLTVSLDDETRTVLDRLLEDTSVSQSELVRQAIQFYESNLEVAENEDAESLWRYSRALNTRDHILLDRDFLHLFLRNLSTDDESFQEDIEQIASYHGPEFAAEFDSVEGVLEWLSFCGLFQYKWVNDGRVQLLFHTEEVKDVMGTFTISVLEQLDYDVDVVKVGITKLVLELPALEE